MSLFIVLEGTDGSGQDTQAQKLVEWLRDQYQENVVLTREPTDSVIGQEIRSILRGENPSPDQAQVQQLMIDDRRLHQCEIKQHLASHEIVVCVRYYYSTLAYGAANGLNMQELWMQNRSFLLPDLTIFLDLSPEISMQRIVKRGLGKELFETEEMLSKVRTNFLKLVSDKYFTEIQLVNANDSVEEVHQSIVGVVKKKFPLRFS